MKKFLKLKSGIAGLLLVTVSCSGSDSSADTSTGPSDSAVSTEAPSTDVPVEPGFTAVTPTTGTVGEVTVEGPITVSNRVP
ncbi:MAG: hypothetical protein F2928_04650, partial [Actinobacteria bacterium]|nr:hypothetical protein [Actinomycetota bacterium]MTB11418.1 hypothetical protein [Actinomycetota bacterium]